MGSLWWHGAQWPGKIRNRLEKLLHNGFLPVLVFLRPVFLSCPVPTLFCSRCFIGTLSKEAAFKDLEVWLGKKNKIQHSLLSHALYSPLPSQPSSTVLVTRRVSSSELRAWTVHWGKIHMYWVHTMNECLISVVVISWPVLFLHLLLLKVDHPACTDVYFVYKQNLNIFLLESL